ncbi:MAG: NUDIX hydrolase [Planctomycetota bacterium]|nr:NUDIX hydrolase [Planctomycetota bacterium]
MSSFKLLKKRSLHSFRVFEIRQETWRGPDKRTFERQTVVHPGAVAVVPFDRRGRILTIKQFRPAVNQILLEIPAGTLEAGEQPLACARRELIEETGFAARKWQRLGAIFTAPGFCSEKIHIFKAWDLVPAFLEKDADEHIDLHPLSREQIRRQIRNGRICDAKTLSALLYLQLQG